MENEASPAGASSGIGPTQPNDPGALNRQTIRKRTKTGCLTCRKRRIKCDEKRPTCTNCVKSRRSCEGYSQRIVFKNPLEQWSGLEPIPYHTSTLPGAHPQYGRGPGYSPGDIFSTISSQRYFGIPSDGYGNPIPIAPHMGGPMELSTPQYQLPSVASQSHQGSPSGYVTIYPNTHHQPIAPYLPLQGPLHHLGPTSPRHPDLPSPTHANDSGTQPQHTFIQIPYRPPVEPINGPVSNYIQGGMGSVPPTPTGEGFSSATHLSASSNGSSYRNDAFQNSGPSSIDDRSPTWDPSLHAPAQPLRGGDRQFTGTSMAVVTSTVPPSESAFEALQSPLDLNEAAREYQIGVGESDYDVEMSPGQAFDMTKQGSKWELFRRLHNEQSDTIPRGYTSFLPPTMLDTYHAEHYASPLKNPHTARVFIHFISATSKSISIFERQSQDSSELFLEPGSNPEQGLWTYTLPMMALQHQGLLHAMLALSSLHIAKLQNGPTAPSMKHYTYSIKRIHNSVGKKNKRHLTTTLAATLLLAFYEVMTADHSKWCWHLRGASYLVQELNFKRMSYYFKREQTEQSAQEEALNYNGIRGHQRRPSNPNIINVDLVSGLVGRTVDWKTPGNTPELEEPFDSQKYHIFQDLFWWYARQDTYQSIISGNRVLLSHQRWADCLPRAGVGDLRAVHGSHDHVILILGRIADYCAKDRERKLRVMGANPGGKWRPDPDMMRHLSIATKTNVGPPPVSAGPSRQTTPGGTSSGAPSPGSAAPSFYGMAPMHMTVDAPEPYKQHATTPPYQSPSNSSEPPDDIAQQSSNALQEWQNIYNALDELGRHFGPGFQPLATDLSAEVSSPFGRPFVYPKYDIAVVWALYYAAYIVLIRGHPAMPPFALVAAAVAIPFTQKLALNIGAIAAGMMPRDLAFPLNPSLGAPLCEVIVPCFVAGVQFTDPSQRYWLVGRARRLEDLTGWASIGMIAQGCEIAWERMGQLGKAPPYQRRDRVFAIPRLPPSVEGIPESLSEQQKVANINHEERLFYAMGILGESSQPRRLNPDGTRPPDTNEE